MAKILIIDDESTILELFRFIFDDAGHDVRLAKNGREALDAIRESVPDFMVLDINMPEMSGREFAIELKRLAAHDPRLKNIPFVVMTDQNFMVVDLNSVFTSTPGFLCFFPKMTPPVRVLEKATEVLKTRG
ncbi:MAG: response regulator [Elusimicrobiota bacterium]|nr:response regulator [Elusimicrobiota bacterium]